MITILFMILPRAGSRGKKPTGRIETVVFVLRYYIGRDRHHNEINNKKIKNLVLSVRVFCNAIQLTVGARCDGGGVPRPSYNTNLEFRIDFEVNSIINDAEYEKKKKK